MSFQAKNFFSNIPIELSIPSTAKVVVVSDFFVSDVLGGAELTTEAIIEGYSAYHKVKESQQRREVFKIHSSSVTQELVKKNADKLWIITNFSFLSMEAILALVQEQVSYSVIEYDFKYCKHRAEYAHYLQTGNSCNCAKTDHGELILFFLWNAKSIHWMAEKQKEKYLSVFPELKNKNHFIQSSTFSSDVLNNISFLAAETKDKKQDTWAFQGSGSWIKGIPETESWLSLHRKKNIKKINSKAYGDFLKELASSKRFVFMPLDYDTCPRVVIEAKLLGCELTLNKNVLHSEEPWFKTSDLNEMKEYLADCPVKFWKNFYESAGH